MEMKYLVEIKRKVFPKEETKVIPFVSKDNEQEVVDSLLKDSSVFKGYNVEAYPMRGNKYAVIHVKENTRLGEIQLTPVFEHLGRYFKLEEIKI